MKAILVIDMPSGCEECPFRVFPPFCSISEIAKKDAFEECEKEMPSWCPLKHPLKSVDNDFYIYDRRYLFDNLDREIKLLMSTKRFEEYMKAKGETE